MSINWDEELKKAEEGSRPISIGTHNFKIVEAKPATASTGNQMIKMSMKAEGGPDNNKVGYLNLVFAFDNPRAMSMTVRRLKTLGIDETWLRSANPSLEQIAGRLIGRSCTGKVTHRDFNGAPQSDIDIIPGTGPVGIPSAPTIPAPVIPQQAGPAPDIPLDGGVQPPLPIDQPPQPAPPQASAPPQTPGNPF